MMQGQQPRMVPPQAQAMKPVPSTNTFKTQDLEKLRIALRDPNSFPPERLAQLKGQPFPVGTLVGLEIDRRNRAQLMDGAAKAGMPKTVADQNMQQLAFADMRRRLAEDENVGLSNIVNQMEQGMPPPPSKMMASGGVVEGYNERGYVESPADKAKRLAREEMARRDEKLAEQLGLDPTTAAEDFEASLPDLPTYKSRGLRPSLLDLQDVFDKVFVDKRLSSENLKKLQDYKFEQADKEYKRKQEDPKAAEYFPDRSDTGAIDRAIERGEITVGPEKLDKEVTKGIGSLAPDQTRAALQSIKLDRLPVPEDQDYLAKKQALEQKLGIGNLSEEVLAKGRERLAKDKELAQLAGISALTEAGLADKRMSLGQTLAKGIGAYTKSLALEKGAERKAERAFEDLELAEKRRLDAEQKGNVKEILAAERDLEKRKLDVQKVNVDIAAKEEQLRNEARKAMSTELYRRELGKYYQAMANKNSGAMTQKDFLAAQKGFLDVLVDLMPNLDEEQAMKMAGVIISGATQGVGGTPQIGTRETR